MNLVNLDQACKIPLLELFLLIPGYSKRCNEQNFEILFLDLLAIRLCDLACSRHASLCLSATTNMNVAPLPVTFQILENQERCRMSAVLFLCVWRVGQFWCLLTQNLVLCNNYVLYSQIIKHPSQKKRTCPRWYVNKQDIPSKREDKKEDIETVTILLNKIPSLRFSASSSVTATDTKCSVRRPLHTIFVAVSFQLEVWRDTLKVNSWKTFWLG